MDITQHTLFEQTFWLPILRDHSQFILDSLSSREKQEVTRAKNFYKALNELILNENFLDLESSYDIAKRLRKFKLHLLERLLTDQIAFHLSPTFINHMVNEVEEYLRILKCLLNKKIPSPCHPLHHHLLWLPDASGHADGLVKNFDGVEKNLIIKGNEFKEKFEDYYFKAVELAGYLRTKLKTFPALEHFHSEVELEIVLFQKFLEELEEMSLDKTMLGTLNPLMADHMYREECYYLTKLSQVSNIKQPSCTTTPKQKI